MFTLVIWVMSSLSIRHILWRPSPVALRLFRSWSSLATRDLNSPNETEPGPLLWERSQSITESCVKDTGFLKVPLSCN